MAKRSKKKKLEPNIQIEIGYGRKCDCTLRLHIFLAIYFSDLKHSNACMIINNARTKYYNLELNMIFSNTMYLDRQSVNIYYTRKRLIGYLILIFYYGGIVQHPASCRCASKRITRTIGRGSAALVLTKQARSKGKQPHTHATKSAPSKARRKEKRERERED